MSGKYKAVFEDDVHSVVDPDGDLMVVCDDQFDAELLVDHLNEPMRGGYIIEEPEDEDEPGAVYTLLDPEDDDVFYHESRSVLEGLLSHLNRLQ